MRSSVISLLEDAQKKMSGYTALFNYRLHNLCVKAAPEALLSITVKVEGEVRDFEKVAQAQNPEGRDDQFEIFPMYKEWLFPIVKGIKEVHPEFELDILDLDDNADENDEDRERYILATMPVIDDNRHDALMQAVKILSDVVSGQLEFVFSRCSADVALKLVNAPAEELDEAKDALQQLHDRHEDLCKTFRADKEEEIEEAYAVWQAAQADRVETRQEEAAHNESAGLQMKWKPEDDD